jgi:hypothetical protein
MSHLGVTEQGSEGIERGPKPGHELGHEFELRGQIRAEFLCWDLYTLVMDACQPEGVSLMWCHQEVPLHRKRGRVQAILLSGPRRASITVPPSMTIISGTATCIPGRRKKGITQRPYRHYDQAAAPSAIRPNPCAPLKSAFQTPPRAPTARRAARKHYQLFRDGLG